MKHVSIQADPTRTPAHRANRARLAGHRHVPRRRWSWRKRGQSTVIFALTLTFLIGVMGLAIDVVRAYDLYAREHRAAEAGALAGDIYMPCFYNSVTSGNGCGSGTSPDGVTTAQSIALAEVQKNGFGQGATPPATCTGADTSAPVTICLNNTGPTALQVTVTQQINVFFLSVLGIPSFNVSATAAADYLPNTILGSGGDGSTGNVWGSGGVSNAKTFLSVINGPAEFQEQGDPFVWCQQGPTSGPPPDDDFSTTAIKLQDKTTNTIAPFTTNHRAYPGGNSQCGGAKDPNNLQPFNLTGPNTIAGNDVYSFQVSSSEGGTIYIWNPIFDPSDPQSNCNGATFPDTFFTGQSCTNYYSQYGPLTPSTTDTKNPPFFDDPRFYFDMVYSLYSFNPVFNTNPGSPSQGPVVYPPADLYKADVALHCPGFNAYLPPSPSAGVGENSTYKGGTIPLVPVGSCTNVGTVGFNAGAWTPVFNVGAGPWRLAVEAKSHYPQDSCGAFTCGWGRHTYSVAFCAAGSTPKGSGGGSSCTKPANGFVAPINDADLYLNFPSGTQNGAIPIANIPTTFAGRTITFSVFNAGYTRANAPNTYFTIVPPDCSPVTIPDNGANWYRTVARGVPSAADPCTGITGGTYTWVLAAKLAQSGTTGDFIYHGLWVDISVTLPSSYKTSTKTQWWFAEDVGSGSKDFGQICLKVSVNNGSPVHLIL